MIASRRKLTERRRPTLVRSDSRGPASNRRHRPDYWLIILCATLLGIGLVVVYSISPGLTAVTGSSQNFYVNKQLLAVLLGVITFLICSSISLNWWRKLTIPLAVVAALGCLAVLFTPIDEVYRAHRWIIIGGFSFQVAELIKFVLLIGLANFLTLNWRRGTLANQSTTLKPLLILVVVIGMVVAGLQSDLGSTGVMIAMIGVMSFVVGIPIKKVVLFAGIIAIGLVMAVSSSGYRRDRLTNFLNPEANCLTTGYQACQALIAVGSGGLLGQGLGHGVEAYGYLPEAANDSIFAIIAEKFGFVGVSLIIGIYAFLISRFKRIAERCPDQFYRLIVIGMMAWISTQAIINIGAMIGLLPLKGITLPFISYGGTSMIFLTAALGLVFQISRYTSYSKHEPENNLSQANDYSNRGRLGRAYNSNLVSRPRT